MDNMYQQLTLREINDDIFEQSHSKGNLRHLSNISYFKFNFVYLYNLQSLTCLKIKSFWRFWQFLHIRNKTFFTVKIAYMYLFSQTTYDNGICGLIQKNKYILDLRLEKNIYTKVAYQNQSPMALHWTKKQTRPKKYVKKEIWCKYETDYQQVSVIDSTSFPFTGYDCK